MLRYGAAFWLNPFFHNDMNSNGPIFVVGAPRSGITLLQRMLRSRPGISSPTGESRFIIPLLTKTAVYGDLSKRENISAVLRETHSISAEFLETDLHGVKFDIETLADAIHGRGAHTMPQVIDTLFRSNGEGEGTMHWLVKTPYCILNIHLLAAIYPDAQFVNIIRDGRDAGRAMGAILPPERYLEFRFEDMLNAREGTLRRVCAYPGVDFSEKVLNLQKSRDPQSKTPLLSEGIKRNNQEKWRDQMKPHHIRTFESAAGSTLAAYGYPVTVPNGKPSLSARAFWNIHNQVMQRINPQPRKAC
jgi:hypothetical protein